MGRQALAALRSLRLHAHACTAIWRQYRPALAACILACVSACGPAERSYRVVDSEFMEFEDLFSPVDTVRFDASVLIGMMRFVDVSDQGDFLITDDQMKAFHVFTASGDHVHSFSVSQCNPDDSEYLLSARFLEGGDMIASTANGVYAFHADGSCKKRLLGATVDGASFCERQDHVYFMEPNFRPPRIYAYSIESGTVRDHDLREPEFPMVTMVKMGMIGRQIACFDRGVFFRYPESSDGEPLFPGNDPVMHRPTFYRTPRRDLIRTDDMSARIDDLMELGREATYSSGIFELDENHRLVTFESPSSREEPLSIINMETQTSVSSGTDLPFELAKHGLLFVRGDYEPLSSGEVGNQMLEIWQFHPFEPSD